jgi:predicted O-methyltransferase YrrM
MHIQKKSLLTDYFHLKIVKLCLTLRCLRALIFSKSAKNVQELALQGVQIGYSAQKMENLFVF